MDSSCDTSSPSQAISHIPKSKTWSITSTIQRVSTDNNGLPTESRPARVSSVVQSTPFSVPLASHDTTTGRTSVTRLRKSFDLGIRQHDGTQESGLDHACTGKSTVHDQNKGWRVLGVLDEHPADDPPNPPTSPNSPATPKPQRKGKVTELKKAFERGLSDFVRKRRTTESNEEGPGRAANARNPRPGHSMKAIDTSSPEDNLSKGSLFCSPLPTTKRREPNGPVSPLKEKISIFEGLVKPSPSSPLTPDCHQGNSNAAKFLTGDKIMEGGSNEPTSRLPSKFRGAPSAAKGSPKQLRNGRGEPEDENSQRIGDADPPSFLRRLSSTFKHKRKPSRQYCAGARSSKTERGAEEETTRHSSPELQSTPKSQKHSENEERQRSAAQSLRKRLESELRSGASTSGHQQTRADQPAGGKQQHDPLTGSQSHRQYDLPSTVDRRRKSTLWVTENPFDVSKAKDRSKSEATGGRLNTIGDRYSGHTESNDFSNVALARVSTSQDVPRQKSSAFRFLQLTESPQPHGTRSSDQTNSTSGQTKDGSTQSGGSEFVVVANAECELTHPRPSRSSEKKMIKVLCKCGRETGEEQDDGGGDSLVSVSKGSSDSFHTAPLSASVC